MDEKKDNHAGLLIEGGIIGAIIGVMAAILLIKSSDEKPHIDSKQGFQLGIGIISLLRSFVKNPNSK